jgi:hypothetical protein
MRKLMSKATVAAVAALSIGVALITPTEPAAAAFRMGGGGFGGGFHGGMGGFGGWHGGMGGWRTAGWGGGWRGGWGGWRGGWGGCRWGGCGWGGGWWWPAAGLATGVALASTYPYWGGYGYGYGYDNGCTQLVPVYSRRGFYLGRRWVNVCY